MTTTKIERRGYYFYKPKYDALYGPYDSIEQRQEDFDAVGGTVHFYDYEPSGQEMNQAQKDYFWN